MNQQDTNNITNIVVIGGGAGGLELAVKLARKFKRQENTNIILVDRNPTHIWKPLLHEIATGSLNGNQDETSYLMLARKHRFAFTLGTVDHIDTQQQALRIAPVTDIDGDEMVAARMLAYDKLIISVGSVCNDFGTPGVMEHALLLDTREQAERFHTRFVSQLHKFNATSPADANLSLIIVGAGATGVELAADLHNVAKRLPDYGFKAYSRERLNVMLVEAAPRILAQLPERVSTSVTAELTNIGVSVKTSTMVSEIGENTVTTSTGETLDANLVVWAAGIRAPEFLATSNLAVDNAGRVVVEPTLSVQNTDNVFAIGDCCACPMGDGKTVPPRAQSAHQMAAVAYRNVLNSMQNKPLKAFIYKDFGSLISLSEFSTIGNLMGNLMRGTVFIEGWLARMFYLSLYRSHQISIHGVGTTMLIMLNDRLYKATRAEIKLH